MHFFIAHIEGHINEAQGIRYERFVICTFFLYLELNVRDDIVVILGDPDHACFGRADQFILYSIFGRGQGEVEGPFRLQVVRAPVGFRQRELEGLRPYTERGRKTGIFYGQECLVDQAILDAACLAKKAHALEPPVRNIEHVFQKWVIRRYAIAEIIRGLHK